MRILEVITLTELGGAQSVVANLANELSARHEVIVAGGEGDGKLWTLLNESIVRESVSGLVRRISPANEAKALLAMRRLYSKYRPDVVHLHSSKAGLLGRLAFPKSRTLYTVHGFDSIRVAFRKFLPLEKILQQRCAAIVGVSRYDEKNMESEGIRRNVCCIYNGVAEPGAMDYDPFAELAAGRPRVLCIARYAAPKRPDLFMDVARRMPDCAFFWIGNQAMPQCDVPSNVYFLGNIAGAGAYTRYADVFCLPSDYEGLPMVIIESLACATPVVASAVGGIPEILDGSNGFAVENDAAKMAACIKQVIDSRSQSSEMSQKARQTYLRNFTVGQMADEYLKIYNTIVSKK